MGPHTIAVVDEDEDFLEQMRELFSSAGYAVRMFSHAESAYAALWADSPSAVIIGLRFPHCRPGIDLATALKLRKETCALPLILTSADAPQLRLYEERLRRRDIPALWMLPKTLVAAEALQIVAQALGRLERAAS
jgi:DNA-binding NtrC family response regulator